MASTRTKTKAAVGVVAYLVWSLFAYIDPGVRADYLKFHITVVLGIAGLLLRDLPPPPPPPHPPRKEPPDENAPK